MQVKRRIKVETRTERTLLLCARRKITRAWCGACLCQTQMITPHEAAKEIRVSLRKLFGYIEERRLHFLETEEGELFICVESLREFKD